MVDREKMRRGTSACFEATNNVIGVARVQLYSACQVFSGNVDVHIHLLAEQPVSIRAE